MNGQFYGKAYYDQFCLSSVACEDVLLCDVLPQDAHCVRLLE